jgi:hypothetical protein
MEVVLTYNSTKEDTKPASKKAGFFYAPMRKENRVNNITG